MDQPVCRVDGWTAERRAAFLVAIEGGASVTAAAASARMSRESAHRLRRRDRDFARLWQATLDLRAAGDERYAAVIESRDEDNFGDHPVIAAHAHLSPGAFDRWLMRSLDSRLPRAIPADRS